MELRPYQREALGQMLDAERFIYGDGAGTGKTATTLRWLAETDAPQTLLVVPDNVTDQWRGQAATWYPELKLVDGRGTPKKRAERREQVLHADYRERVALVLNYELLRQDIAHLREEQFDTFVLDESQTVKENKAQVFKAAKLMARRSRLLAMLTGTPIMNVAHEAWAALHMIDPRAYPSFHAWAREHFEYEMSTFHGKLPRPVPVIGDPLPGHDDVVAAQVGTHLIARPIEYCIPHLPPVTHFRTDVEFSPEERRIYTSIRKKGWADLNGEILKAPSEVVRMTRLRQLTSDWNGLADMGRPGAKVATTAEYLREMTEQVVVIVGYKETAEQLADALYDRDVEYIHGDKAKDVRRSTIERFRAGDTQVLIGTHPTLGTGVDGLQCASNIELLDQDWTPARNDQAIARVRRSGQQADTVNAGRVLVADSTDDDVQAANDRKRDVVDRIVTANYQGTKP